LLVIANERRREKREGNSASIFMAETTRETMGTTVALTDPHAYSSSRRC